MFIPKSCLGVLQNDSMPKQKILETRALAQFTLCGLSKALFLGLSFGYGAINLSKNEFQFKFIKVAFFCWQQKPREEKDKLYSSDVWAIITEIEACVLFLCLYWWSQVKGLVIYIYFFWLKITHAWSRQHSLVHDSDNFSVQGQIVNICGKASHCICESVLQLGDCPCSVKAVADE